MAHPPFDPPWWRDPLRLGMLAGVGWLLVIVLGAALVGAESALMEAKGELARRLPCQCGMTCKCCPACPGGPR